jgi:branched-chain amino acid aminotransferase
VKAILASCIGHIAESDASNIFIVKSGVLYTPAAGVLRGISRDTVLEIADELNIPWQEHQLSAFDLYVADEVFYVGVCRAI